MVRCGGQQASCEGALERQGRSLRTVAVVPTFLEALMMVKESDVLALLPARLVARHAGWLCARELPFEAHGIALYMAFQPRASGDARHRWLTDSLLAHAAEQRELGARHERRTSKPPGHSPAPSRRAPMRRFAQP